MSGIQSASIFDGPSCQSDELEALCAIYSDDFMFVEPESNIYAIRISASKDRQIVFQFQYPEDYPNEKLIYEIQASWLRSPLFDLLICQLDQHIHHTVHEPIVHCLIECIREFLNSEASDDNETPLIGDDEIFDVSNLVEHLTLTNSVADNLLPPVRAHLNCLPLLMPVATGSEDVLIYHGEPFVDRKSIFQAHMCCAYSVGQVSRFVTQVLSDKKVAAATHNILAWRVVALSASQTHTEQMHCDCDDDGETHAGSRLLHLLTISGAKNVCVMVSRWYGGVPLGPDRFKHINNVARKLLCSQQIIGSLPSSDKSKKRGKSSKHKK